MRVPVLLALCAVPAALVACQPDHPRDSVVGDSHAAAPAKPDLQYAPPVAQRPAETQAQNPPTEPPMANGPPTVIIQPPPR